MASPGVGGLGESASRAEQGCQVTVVSPTSLTPATPIVGQPTTATFTIQNMGDQPCTIDMAVAGVTAGTTFGDTNRFDFPQETDISLDPGQTYTYSEQTIFTASGPYVSLIGVYLNGGWLDPPGDQALVFNVAATASSSSTPAAAASTSPTASASSTPAAAATASAAAGASSSPTASPSSTPTAAATGATAACGSSSGAPQLLQPRAESTLGRSATFCWSAGSGVTAYMLWVGHTVDNPDIFNSHMLSSSTTSLSVSPLPTDGSTIYAVLWWQVGGAWQASLTILRACSARAC